MSTTLYRKYRPQTFSDLVGQQHVRSTLLAELEAGKVAHAFLFVGPRGVGKTTTARLLAKAVNCERPKKHEPCNQCLSCTGINDGRSLDLIEVDAASHTQVDHVRENILPAVRTVPAGGKYKVFIIDEVHMLSTSAFNALLKTLEEPPAHAIFILATTEVHRVPVTIVSRCQRFDFRRVEVPVIAARLKALATAEKISVAEEVLDRVARVSGGSLRDAESVLGQLIALGGRSVSAEHADLLLPTDSVDLVLELIESIGSGRTQRGLELVQQAVDDGVKIEHLAGQLVEILRLLLLERMGVPSLQSYDGKTKDRLERLSKQGAPNDLVRMIDVFQRRERDIRRSSLPQLPLELGIVELTDGAGQPPATPVGPSASQPPSARQSKSASEAGDGKTWGSVMEKMRKSNPSLAVLLNNARPRGMVGQSFVLALPYSFHLERLREAKNQSVVEAALHSVLGQDVKLSLELLEPTDSTQLTETEPSSPPPASDVWQQALEVFSGGEGGGRAATTS